MVNESESILTSVKKVLGLPSEVTDFDLDIIMHINSTFSVLHQIGVGPEEGYYISDDSNTWDEFIENSDPRYNIVKSFMYLKVRVLFDPPQNSVVLNSFNEQIKEYTYRLYVLADNDRTNNI